MKWARPTGVGWITLGLTGVRGVKYYLQRIFSSVHNVTLNYAVDQENTWLTGIQKGYNLRTYTIQYNVLYTFRW